MEDDLSDLLKDVLSDLLSRQFYGFLNLAFRNPWLIRGIGKPSSISQRANQINSFLRQMHLHKLMFCDEKGDLIFKTEHAKELHFLTHSLSRMVGTNNVKKMAEIKDGHVKLSILMFIEDRSRPFYLHYLRFLSPYRKKLARSMETLVKLQLVEKSGKAYRPTKSGRQFGHQIIIHHLKWEYEMEELLLSYLSGLFDKGE